MLRLHMRGSCTRLGLFVLSEDLLNEVWNADRPGRQKLDGLQAETSLAREACPRALIYLFLGIPGDGPGGLLRTPLWDDLQHQD